MASLSLRTWRYALVGFALLAVAGVRQGRAATDSGSIEYAVKANYLYKFAPFIEWPRRAFAAPDSPFAICVIGDDPFGASLDDAVKGQRVDGHPVIVRRAPVAAPDPPCHVMFAGRSAKQPAADVFRVVAGQPVLTVCDQDGDISCGMIRFVLMAGRVRFAIDAAAAQASGLSISSKLLGLAVKPAGSGR